MQYLESFKKTISSNTELFKELLKTDEFVKTLFNIIDNIESSQEGLWKHIDYGIRTPAFRHMQWIEYGVEYEYEDLRILEIPIVEVNIHLLKEYFHLWFTLLDFFPKIEKDRLISKLKDIIEKNELFYYEDEINAVSKELTSGISNELKASYVLTDHRKPFLPFSIMQAPIVPAIIRVRASGDLYLFEENLVVDVKSGWLDKVDSLGYLPTYYYSERINLSEDLRKCRDIGTLFGIRKGIGVVAEDTENEIIHFAVYVPWRYSRIHGPLLYLISRKLPFLIYIHRKDFEAYVGKVINNVLTVDLEAIMMSKNDKVWIDSSKWEIYAYAVEIRKSTKGRKRIYVSQEIRSGKLNFKQVSEKHYRVRVEIPVNEKNKLRISSNKRSFEDNLFAFELVHKDTNLRIPVLVST